MKVWLLWNDWATWTLKLQLADVRMGRSLKTALGVMRLPNHISWEPLWLLLCHYVVQQARTQFFPPLTFVTLLMGRALRCDDPLRRALAPLLHSASGLFNFPMAVTMIVRCIFHCKMQCKCRAGISLLLIPGPRDFSRVCLVLLLPFVKKNLTSSCISFVVVRDDDFLTHPKPQPCEPKAELARTAFCVRCIFLMCVVILHNYLFM